VVSNQLIDHKTVFPLELNTMPGWAGSSWYFFRYMEEANRAGVFASEDALKYWENVDLYIGGAEHATGHLLYSRFWVKLLKDRGFVNVEEPFKKLINQGMILGTSAFVYRLNNEFVIKDREKANELGKRLDWPNGSSESIVDEFSLTSKNIFLPIHLCTFSEFKKYKRSQVLSVEEIKKLKHEDLAKSTFEAIKKFIPNDKIKYFDTRKYIQVYSKHALHTDVSFVNSSGELDLVAFKNWRADYKDAEFILEDGVYKVGRDVEKMSKSKYNVVSPDQICIDYGADSLRLYEMFLGPLEQYKPWNTAGITGVHSFLKKLWKLYVNDNGLKVNDAAPTKDNLKTLHKTIKKVQEDIENFSFNTSVSTFMIAVNELGAQKCTSKAILEPLLVLISPYAPHIAEELYSKLGNTTSISTVPFPEFEASHLVESSKNYPISFNGKMRFTLELPMDLSKDDIEKTVLAHEKTIAQLDGREPKKVIVVPGKIVNIVG